MFGCLFQSYLYKLFSRWEKTTEKFLFKILSFINVTKLYSINYGHVVFESNLHYEWTFFSCLNPFQSDDIIVCGTISYTRTYKTSKQLQFNYINKFQQSFVSFNFRNLRRTNLIEAWVCHGAMCHWLDELIVFSFKTFCDK